MARAATMRKDRAFAPPPDYPGAPHVHARPPGPPEGGWASVRNFVFICLGIVVGGLGFVGWLMTNSGPQDVPLIEAEAGPYKSRPPAQEAKAASASPSLDQALVEETLVIEDVTARPKPETPLKTANAKQPAPKATSQAAAAIDGDGAFLAQIASLRSREAAEAAWARIAARQPDVFGAAKMDIEAADLAEKGVYHRVRAGYFASRATATKFCEAVRAGGQECLVVSR
jgi:hypothetical protein